MIFSSVDFRGHSVFFRPGTVDQNVLDHSFDKDIFYASAPEYRGSKDAIVIDVGAHIGTFSIYSIVAGKAGAVVAVEANSESYSVLEKNVNDNHFHGKIKPIHAALSDKNGIERLYLDQENWGHSLTNTSLSEFEEVPSLTLGELLDKEGIKECDLIKFNCEGAEFKIILSLNTVVMAKVKMMIILFHEDLVIGKTRNDLIAHLLKHGFLTRLDYVDKNRGWIVAKNKKFYNTLPHIFIKTRKSTQTKIRFGKAKLRHLIVTSSLWKYAKRIIRKTEQS